MPGKGQPMSAEHRAKIADAMRGNKNAEGHTPSAVSVANLKQGRVPAFRRSDHLNYPRCAANQTALVIAYLEERFLNRPCGPVCSVHSRRQDLRSVRGSVAGFACPKEGGGGTCGRAMLVEHTGISWSDVPVGDRWVEVQESNTAIAWALSRGVMVPGAEGAVAGPVLPFGAVVYFPGRPWPEYPHERRVFASPALLAEFRGPVLPDPDPHQIPMFPPTPPVKFAPVAVPPAPAPRVILRPRVGGLKAPPRPSR